MVFPSPVDLRSSQPYYGEFVVVRSCPKLQLICCVFHHHFVISSFRYRDILSDEQGIALRLSTNVRTWVKCFQEPGGIVCIDDRRKKTKPQRNSLFQHKRRQLLLNPCFTWRIVTAHLQSMEVMTSPCADNSPADVILKLAVRTAEAKGRPHRNRSLANGSHAHRLAVPGHASTSWHDDFPVCVGYGSPIRISEMQRVVVASASTAAARLVVPLTLSTHPTVYTPKTTKTSQTIVATTDLTAMWSSHRATRWLQVCSGFSMHLPSTLATADFEQALFTSFISTCAPAHRHGHLDVYVHSTWAHLW
nr:hypothetical protein CFP56_02784 [Quercus suber]